MKCKFPRFLKIVTLDKSHGSRTDIIAGLTKLLSEYLHFSYDLIYSIDGQLGQQYGPSNWTGIIGMLNRSECDMSVDPIIVTESRNEAVLFSYPYQLLDITFITNKPEAKPKSFAIIQPFSTSVWIALIVSFFCVSFLFYAISGKKYSDMLFMLFGNMFSQPSNYTPKKMSSKLLMILWMVGMFFLIVCYQATLLSFLSFPSYVGVRNVQELSEAVNRSTYKCLTRKGSFLINYLSNSPDDSMKVIGQSLKKHGSLSMNADEFLQSGKGAYISTRTLLIYLKEKYFLSPDVITFSMASVSLRKNFTCKEDLDPVLRKVTEGGIYEKIVQDAIFKAVLLERSTFSFEEYRKQINVDDLGGAFVFLIMGNIFGLLTFLIEIIIHKWKCMLGKKKSCDFIKCITKIFPRDA